MNEINKCSKHKTPTDVMRTPLQRPILSIRFLHHSRSFVRSDHLYLRQPSLRPRNNTPHCINISSHGSVRQKRAFVNRTRLKHDVDRSKSRTQGKNELGATGKNNTTSLSEKGQKLAIVAKSKVSQPSRPTGPQSFNGRLPIQKTHLVNWALDALTNSQSPVGRPFPTRKHDRDANTLVRRVSENPSRSAINKPNTPDDRDSKSVTEPQEKEPSPSPPVGAQYTLDGLDEIAEDTRARLDESKDNGTLTEHELDKEMNSLWDYYSTLPEIQPNLPISPLMDSRAHEAREWFRKRKPLRSSSLATPTLRTDKIALDGFGMLHFICFDHTLTFYFSPSSFLSYPPLYIDKYTIPVRIFGCVRA
jgi:hypothetical protein